jgi:hypothetical protein
MQLAFYLKRPRVCYRKKLRDAGQRRGSASVQRLDKGPRYPEKTKAISKVPYETSPASYPFPTLFLQPWGKLSSWRWGKDGKKHSATTPKQVDAGRGEKL